jgi:hypothetical protein
MSITTRAPYGFELEYMPLDAFGGTGPHRLTPVAAALGRKMPTLHGGSAKKVFKTVVSVVAAVAIPFVAPAIASSIGLSTAIGSALGSATAGSVIGGALTGATLGAVKGAVLGEDIRSSALMGGIGGGISGYGYTSPGAGGGTGISPTASTTTGQGLTATGGQGLTATGGQGLTYSGATTAGGIAQTSAPLTGVGGAFGPVDYGLTAGMAPTGITGFTGAGSYGLQAPTSYYDIGAALSSGTPIDYSLAAGMTSPAAGLSVTSTAPSGATQTTTAGGTMTAPTSGTVTAPTTTTGITSTTPTDYTLTGATGGTTGATAGTTTEPSFLQQMGSAVTDKFKDPKALADLTLRAAGMLAGSALSTQGLTPEEMQALNSYTEELRRLQETDQALFNQRLEQAQNLIGESKYFDPEYFGLQRARRTQAAGARAKRAGLRGLSGERRAAEARRYDLATARDTGSAFDQGYLTGIQGRLQTQQAGLSAFPTQVPSGGFATNEYNALMNAYKNADDRTAAESRQISSMFGQLTGIGSSNSLG